jgi:hypothetical protein
MTPARIGSFKGPLRLAAAFVLLLASARGAHAGEAFYLLMFGSQRTPANPSYSHTWATFVRATWEGDGPCPHNPTIEEHTMSWLPETMVVRLWALLPECGALFELHTTIHWALDTQQRISMWGPYQIEPDLYYKAMDRLAHLGSGRVRYKAIDSGYSSDRVTNCIHAVAGTVGGLRVRVGTPGWGETASFTVLQRFRPWIYNRDEVHSWVGSALGLDEYPIIYRDWGRTFSGGIVGPFNRLLGGERGLSPTYGPPAH